MADLIENKDLNKQGVPSTLGQPPQMAKLKPIGGPTSSGQFTNLSRVIGANQGNKLSSTISGNVQNLANQTKQAAGNAFQNFQTQANQNRLDTGQNTQQRQDIINRYGVTSQNVQGPTDQEAAAFEKFRGGQYQGPTTLQNEQDLQNKAASINNLRQGFNTEQGRFGVLQKFLGNRNYTTGQKQLDSALLGGAGNTQVRAGLQNAASSAADTRNKIAAAQLLGQDYTQRAKGFGEETQNLLDTTRQANQSQIDQSVKTAEADKAARIQRIKDALAGSGDVSLSQEDLNMLGVKEGQDVFSDYAQALNPSNTAATAQNVASANDYAKFQALAKLAGRPEELYSDPTQAGTFFKNQVNLDQDMANAIRQQHLQDVKNNLGPNLQWYLSAKRNAENPQLNQVFTPNFGFINMGPSAEQERQIQRDQQNAINNMLASKGFQGVDLNQVFSNLDTGNMNNWYNTYQNTGADILANALIGARKFRIANPQNT